VAGGASRITFTKVTEKSLAVADDHARAGPDITLLPLALEKLLIKDAQTRAVPIDWSVSGTLKIGHSSLQV
jgi:hypothetical protein